MFLRYKTIKQNGKQYKYYQIVESQRIKGKVRQKLILSLGDLEQATNIAKATVHLVENLGLIDVDTEIAPVWSKEYGLPFVFQRLFNDCGLKEIINNIALKHKKLGFDLKKTVFNLILNRLMEPCSEHRIAKHWNRNIYEQLVAKIKLQHLYRAVRLLSQYKEEIEQCLFSQTRDLFHQKIDLAFFDTTSTYLYGKESESLSSYGYSRDRRSNCKQVLIGVLLGPESIPLGCEILPGHTTDLEAMVRIIQKVKKRFFINKIILVSDGGMNSKDNRKLLAEEKLEYILGTRMRSIKIVKEYLQKHYPLTFDGSFERQGKNGFSYKEVFLNSQRYIIIYNPEEAKRQKQTRQEIISQLENQLKIKGLKSLIKNKGQRRYLRINNKKTRNAVGIDHDKAKKEEIFDGLFVCETNNTDLKAREIVREYKNLWQVERAFRDLKDIIEMRPIYHQIDQMIKGHIFVSFLALYLEMYLRKKLFDSNFVKTDLDELINEIKAIKAIKIQIKDKSVVMRTELGKAADQLFRALSIRPPNRILEKWKEVRRE